MDIIIWSMSFVMDEGECVYKYENLHSVSVDMQLFLYYTKISVCGYVLACMWVCVSVCVRERDIERERERERERVCVCQRDRECVRER